MKKSKTNEQFVDQAKNVHGNKYIYDKTNYVNKRSKVCITCPKHGDFWQNAQSHLNGCGCKECMKERFRMTYDVFLSRANNIHNNKYDYSLITKENFKGATSLIEIICPIHGVFRQKVENHLHGQGCKKCADNLLSVYKSDTKDEFIKKAKAVHDDKYDYIKVKYINQGTNVCIICKKHGEFWQRPNHHLSGVGCPSCKSSFGEERISLFLKKHNILYNFQYSIYNENLFCQNKRLYVDFFLPNLNTIIEFNGIQHYKPIGYFGGEKALIRQNERDNSLRQYCKEHKIKLIEISYNEYAHIDSILKKELKL